MILSQNPGRAEQKGRKNQKFQTAPLRNFDLSWTCWSYMRFCQEDVNFPGLSHSLQLEIFVQNVLGTSN